jgi:ATP-dependent Clp protease ATP-binding subunit ClpC
MGVIDLSPDSQHILDSALGEAKSSQAAEVDTVHIFLALLSENEETRESLRRSGHNPDELGESIRKEAQLWFPSDPIEPEASTGYITTMRAAQQIALDAHNLSIEPSHLLQAIFNQHDRLSDYLTQRNITVKPTTVTSKTPTPLLNMIGRDLTELARQGKLMPVIGRDHDVEMLVEILLRHGKNNALLLGEAGVGKTAVAEKLAQEIVAGRVPDPLQDKRIVELNMSSLVAGTSYRGQFEEKLQAVLSEIQRAGNVIILIDEFHTIMRAGAVEGGAGDAGNILKPALARGELTCIGITTQDEYTRFIEQDSALARRFQTLVIEEPTSDQAQQILEGIKQRYEAHHNLIIEPESLRTIIDLSVRFLPSRKLPDKAIDVLASAASRAQMRGVDVTPALIAEVVSGIAGVPITQLTSDEAERLADLEKALSARVVGQDVAVQSVARAVRLARVGLKEDRKPVGVFLFAGPTGVGKTELARSLAEVMFGSEQALLRFDMSEFSEKHSVSRLIGSPPGYIGYEEAGQLTQSIREHPYSVVLFDEVEKAHPEVFDLFLQLFDEGRLTDTHGRVADGRNALFILTSNIGSTNSTAKAPMGFNQIDSRASARRANSQDVLSELKNYFRIEFLNRIDEIVVFAPLTTDNLKAIAQMQLKEITEQLEGRAIALQVEVSALDYLVQAANDTGMGARALKRLIQQEIVTPISDQLVKHHNNPPQEIIVTLDNRTLSFRWA